MKRKRFVKKMTSWIRGGGILLLSNISLVSVGFASWTIGGAMSADAEIRITVDDIITGDIFNDVTVNTFTLSSDGIVSNGKIVDSGTVDVSLNIDNKLCKDCGYLNSSNLFKFNVTLSANDAFMKSFSEAKTNDGFTITKENSSADCLKYAVSSTLDAEKETTRFAISYTFSNTVKNSFSSMPDLQFLAKAVKA